MTKIEYRTSPPLDNAALNDLFASAWEGHTTRDFAPILSRSLATISAYAGDVLVGFVNLAWDGGCHAFLLDTTVHPAWQKQGIGRQLVLLAASAARERGVEWLHVDYEPHLDSFYRGCGFQPTLAGLINLSGL
jgi:GNAT superfamily N-acetyltransferase